MTDFDRLLSTDIIDDLEGPLIDFWTPGRIAEYLDKVNRRMSAFDTRVMSSAAPDQFKGEWRGFYDGWASFAEAHEGWFSRFGAGTVDDIERYERELVLWRKELKQLGEDAGVNLDAARKSPQTLTASPWLWLGAAAAVVGAWALGRAS